MAIQWEKLVTRMDQLIRTGKSALVVEEFERLKKTRVPREMVERLANLSYRVGIPEFGLRLLNPYVRGESEKTAEATDLEKAEYAYGLVRVGAPEEALEILEKLDPIKNPKVKYYKACAYISRWNYAASIPHLESYISVPEIGSYDRIVAEVNLASAYVYEKESAKADKILGEIIQSAQANSLRLVLGKALQLKAENFLNLKEWGEFDPALEDAAKLFQLTSGRDKFFVEKLAFQKSLEIDPRSPEVRRRYVALKSQALQIEHFESARDLDRLMAVYGEEVDLFLKVHFGTPHQSYRERLVRDFGKTVEIPESFNWQLADTEGKEAVDLAHSTFGKGDTAFDLGTLPHKLLVALCKDFYAPQRIATLHHQIYPGEFFNPLSSPARIHRAIHRLREWMEDGRLPILIEETKEFYALKATRPASIKVHTAVESVGAVSEAIFRLLKLYPDRPFSIAEASVELGVPVRTLSRQIKKCLDEGKISRIGSGSKIKYVVVLSKKAA